MIPSNVYELMKKWNSLAPIGYGVTLTAPDLIANWKKPYTEYTGPDDHIGVARCRSDWVQYVDIHGNFKKFHYVKDTPDPVPGCVVDPTPLFRIQINTSDQEDLVENPRRAEFVRQVKELFSKI